MSRKTEIKVKVSLLPQWETLDKKKCLIAVCPTFKVDTDILKLELNSTKFKAEELIAGFLQIKAKETSVLVGIAWLYWDYLLLDSLTTANDQKHEKKSIQEIRTLESMHHPKSAEIKYRAQQEEKRWLAEQKNLNMNKKNQVILSGDLLDNLSCQELYTKLNDYCKSTKGKRLADMLGVQTEKFTKRYFKKILDRTDLVCQYFEDSPKVLAKKYLTEYTRFEFSAFAYLAFQGYTGLLTDHVDEPLKKAMAMVMGFFMGLAEAPLLHKMEVSKVEFTHVTQQELKPAAETDTESDGSPMSIEPSSPYSADESDSELPENDVKEHQNKSNLTLKLKLIRFASEDKDTPEEDRLDVIRLLTTSGQKQSRKPLTPVKNPDYASFPMSKQDRTDVVRLLTTYEQKQSREPLAPVTNPDYTSFAIHINDLPAKQDMRTRTSAKAVCCAGMWKTMSYLATTVTQAIATARTGIGR